MQILSRTHQEAAIKKTENNALMKIQRNDNPCAQVGMQNGIAIQENCMAVPQKIKTRITI